MKQMDVIRIIAKNIHDIRLEKNISMQELAEKTDTDINVLKKLGSGECSGLGIPLYIKIAEGLGVSLDEIMRGIEFVED